MSRHIVGFVHLLDERKLLVLVEVTYTGISTLEVQSGVTRQDIPAAQYRDIFDALCEVLG